MSEKTLGQKGYEAYCASTGWKSLVSGAQLPEWKNVKGDIQLAWENAGLQIAYGLLGEIGVLKASRDALVETEQHVRTELNNTRGSLNRLQNEVWKSLGQYSEKLGWGLTGIQPECWSCLDSSVDELVAARKEIKRLRGVMMEAARAHGKDWLTWQIQLADALGLSALVKAGGGGVMINRK